LDTAVSVPSDARFRSSEFPFLSDSGILLLKDRGLLVQAIGSTLHSDRLSVKLFGALVLVAREWISDSAKLETAMFELQEKLGEYFSALGKQQISFVLIGAVRDAIDTAQTLLKKHSSLEEAVPHNSVLRMQDVLNAVCTFNKSLCQTLDPRLTVSYGAGHRLIREVLNDPPIATRTAIEALDELSLQLKIQRAIGEKHFLR
jgi:hypothetical protein